MGKISLSLWEQSMLLAVAEAPKLPPRPKRKVVVIVFQRGMTNYGFQFGRIWFYVNRPSYWKTSGFFGSHGYDKYNRGVS